MPEDGSVEKVNNFSGHHKQRPYAPHKILQGRGMPRPGFKIHAVFQQPRLTGIKPPPRGGIKGGSYFSSYCTFSNGISPWSKGIITTVLLSDSKTLSSLVM